MIPYPSAITTKQQHYRCMQAGLYGNEIQSVKLADVIIGEASPVGRWPVVVRTLNSGGGPTFYHLYDSGSLRDAIYQCYAKGYTTDQIMISEQMPDQLATLQGYYCYALNALDYFTFPCHMKEGMVSGREMTTESRTLMKVYIDPPMYDHVMFLAELYPEHIIEFSCYRVPVGSLGWRGMIWEVRYY